MRYYDVPDITFTNASGRTVVIKDLLPIKKRSQNAINMRITKGDSLDEIASRSNVYGDDHEAYAYDIFAENVEEITFANFNTDRTKKLRIPS